MLYFAVFATAGIAVQAALITYLTTHHWLMLIFPVWNGINGAILLILFYSGVANADCVEDTRASRGQLLITLLSVSLLLTICRLGLRLDWTMAYSICACYTMTLNHTLQDYFGSHFEHLTTLEQVPQPKHSS